jgi:enoyl-CoA hydratase/carnithine racemase
MDSLDEAGYVYYLQTEFELFDVIERLPYVTVAVINGPCLGNAAELVLGCDFRLASTTATFGLSETKVGFSAPTQRLPHFVPVSVAKDLLFRGRILAAEEAGALNLFHEVVAPEELAERARAFLAELAQLPPVAIRLTKQKLALSYGPGAPGADDQMACALECYRTNDFREGVAAFFAKRAPNFTGT